MSKKRNNNYLDFIPAVHPRNQWSQDQAGIVTVHMVHRGFYAAIAQRFFHTPRVSHIQLDEYGSFLWKQIDGRRTVGELALAMKDRFGDGAEPLYDRLVHYMQILHNNRFIFFQGKDRVKL